MSPLASLADVKSYLGISGSTSDAELNRMIAGYSDAVRQYTNRDFTIESYDIWRSGRSTYAIMLPQWPIVSVTRLEINGLAIPAQPSFGSYGYRFSERELIVDGTCFAFGNQNIRIAYSAGYASVPDDIANAVVRMVGTRFQERERIGIMSQTLDGQVVAYDVKAMPADVMEVLRQRRTLVPA